MDFDGQVTKVDSKILSKSEATMIVRKREKATTSQKAKCLYTLTFPKRTDRYERLRPDHQARIGVRIVRVHVTPHRGNGQISVLSGVVFTTAGLK